ncbi:hypothetical protein A2U01_0081924, partial [Trifolium medium]|nr:hypothetical protein [Trifolium medium]
LGKNESSIFVLEIFGDEKVFRSRDAHSDLLRILPGSSGLFFFDAGCTLR